jgi:hypothetical protein
MCCTVTIFFFTATTGLMAKARYRIPIEPILLILAVYGLSCLINMRRKNGFEESL